MFARVESPEKRTPGQQNQLNEPWGEVCPPSLIDEPIKDDLRALHFTSGVCEDEKVRLVDRSMLACSS